MERSREFGGAQPGAADDDRAWHAGRHGPGWREREGIGPDVGPPPHPASGRPPRGYTRSDERIRDDVMRRLLGSGGLDLRDVDVQVCAGEVVLSGEARSREERERIEDLAEGVLGVRRVDDRLRVRRD